MYYIWFLLKKKKKKEQNPDSSRDIFNYRTLILSPPSGHLPQNYYNALHMDKRLLRQLLMVYFPRWHSRESAPEIVFKSKHTFIAKRCYMKYFHLENENYLCLLCHSSLVLHCLFLLYIEKLGLVCELCSHQFPKTVTPQRRWITSNIADWQPFNLRTSASISVVAKTRKKKHEDFRGKGHPKCCQELSLQAVFINKLNYVLPPLHSWVIPLRDVPLTRCVDSSVQWVARSLSDTHVFSSEGHCSPRSAFFSLLK